MADYAKQVRHVLREAGWEFLRPGKGDHEIWHDPKSNLKVTLNSGTKSRHSANEVLKQAGLPKAF